MANQTKRLTTNVDGNFFVDATCINCDTCRQLAPKSFREIGEYSAVVQQPTGDQQRHQAYQALLACPVGSIGTVNPDQALMAAARASFPLHLEDGVFYTGFNSEKSFGANSFFVRQPQGNWLIDSPRYTKQLVEAFERMGGIAYIFLSHEDDVADSQKYAKRFGARRVIHRADADAAPGAEWVIDGEDPVDVISQFRVIPVPGHTAGSMALLYRDRYLFTGDHLWWDPEHHMLDAPQQLVWSKPQLLKSIARLLDLRFEWVLAGHGDRIHLPVAEMHAHLQALLDRRQGSFHTGGVIE